MSGRPPGDPRDRLAALERLADRFEERRAELVAAIVDSSKRLRREAEGEVALAIARLRSIGELLPLLGDRRPVGTVGVVFPGNASLSNPAASLGTAFLAGNRVVGRFPRAAAAWARRVEPLFESALPGVSFAHGTGQRLFADAFADPEVKVLLVFGDDAWAAGYEEAARRSRTKLVFEGPGNDPFLVLPGADLERAAADAVRGGYYNAGQACTSPERIYVHGDLYDDFVERVVELTVRQVVGAPERDDVTVGPIVSRRVVERIARQLDDARVRGARVLAGGRIESMRLADGTEAARVEPTVLVDVDERSLLMQEETFGPLLPIRRVADGEEALRLANATRYGLAASLYGGGEEAPALAAGLARGHGPVFRDEIWIDYFGRELHAPYGGRKASGWVWAWEGGEFVRRDGVRTNVLELSAPAPAAAPASPPDRPYPEPPGSSDHPPLRRREELRRADA